MNGSWAHTKTRGGFWRQRPATTPLNRLGFRVWRYRLAGVVVGVGLLGGSASGTDAGGGPVSEIALEFPARGDAVAVGTSGLQTGAGTIEFLTYPASLQPDAFFFGHQEPEEVWRNRIQVKVDGDSWAVGFGANARLLTGIAPIRMREWQRVSVAWDSESVRFYVDGNLKGEAPHPGGFDAIAETMYLMNAGLPLENANGAKGMLQDVRAWNHARGEAEILADRFSSLKGNEPGLVGYWPLDDGAGTTVRNLAGENDGRFIGNPHWVLARPFVSDLTRHREFERGRTVVLGPVEPRDPRGKVSYQWYFDGEPIAGATGNALTVSEMTEADIGTYHVVIDDERALTPIRSSRVRVAKPDWPMWRFDAARSADTPHELAPVLHLQWVRELPAPERAWRHQWDHRGKLDFDLSYAPVVKEGRIFVPSNATDSVTAYGIDDGAEMWRFYTGGPVRLAPAAWNGRVFFVSDDGYLYCVDSGSGELLWAFRGGPSDHRLLGNERIISFWPARGGPVVSDGTVYFSAGIWPLHGVFIYALDAKTGEVVWVNDSTSSDYVPLPHGGAYGYGGLVPQGYLAVDEDRLIVSGGRGPSAVFDRETGASIEIDPRKDHKGGGGYGVHSEGMGVRRNTMLQDRLAAVRDEIAGDVFYKLAARDRLFVTTKDGTLYCFGPEERVPRRHAHRPTPLDSPAGNSGQVVGALLEELDESEGYALVLGAGSGDLARALLKQSALRVLVVEPDPERVRTLRDELVDAGMYGRRASVVESDPATFSVQPYLFSLVLSEDVEAAGIGSDAATLESVLDRLRPYGGLAWLGASPERLSPIYESAAAVAPDQVVVSPRPGHLFARRAGPLTGAGQWTHQHHDEANTMLSLDERVRLPLGLLWFGGPGNDNILPRHAGGPRPQIAAGRQVFLGVETISARCVYTGRELWERAFPGIGHPFTDMELEERWAEGEEVYMTNIPGATYIGSPFVTLPDSIYLRYGGRIHRLDPATGETSDAFELPGRSVVEIYGDEAPDWGHLSVQGDLLIATAEPHIFEDQELGWTESYSGTSSRRIVVMDRHTGAVQWEREARIGFRHNAIVAANDTLYLIDGLSENALEHLMRRGIESAEASEVFALDLGSGAVRWRTDSNVFGTFLIYAAEHEILIEGGSQDLRRTLEDEPRRMTARRGADGAILWERSGDFTLPGVVRGEMLIPGRPGTARSILTGEDWMREQPHTGERSGWSYSRAYGCNTLNASVHLLMYRSGYAGFFDLEHDTGTGTFGGFRSGCTANMIAADGVLNALDYTRTCTCSYPHQTSLAMVHMPGDSNIEVWTRYDASPPDPEGYGLNFGAPGRRVDASNRVWHDFSGTHRRHPSAISPDEGGIDWVGASAWEINGEEIIAIDDLLPTGYTVKLHFAELEAGVAAGQRVFDVIINGEERLRGFDIVAEAAGCLRGIVKEFSVNVASSMTIELRRSTGSERAPMINGIELIAGEGG